MSASKDSAIVPRGRRWFSVSRWTKSRRPSKAAEPEDLDTAECPLAEHLDPVTGLSVLCATCLGLFRYQLAAVEFPPTSPCAPFRVLQYQEFFHHMSLADLQQAVDGGCHLCYTILGRWHLLPEPGRRDIVTRGFCLKWVPQQQPDTNRIMFYFGHPSQGAMVFPNGLTMKHWEMDKRNPSLEASLYTVANTTASPESSDLALSWIQNCLHTHELCREYARANTRSDGFPARLVDVASLGPDYIRLHFPTSLQDAQPYLTLSHRWGGGASVVQLTAQTAPALSAGFPVAALPRTFREAIAVARRLGVARLWIDSLCIRQDDAADWTAQGGIMGYIYLNGLCNVAASAGEHSDAGLFRRRDPNLLRPVAAEIPWRSRGPAASVLRYYICPDDYWTDQVTDAALYRRGWVAQERVLSVRTLHFGKAQVAWECLQQQANESFPSSNVFLESGGPAFSGGGLSKALTYFLAGGRPLNGRSEHLFIAWEAFVEAYSCCELTFDTDVLHAIEGIAQVVRAMLLRRSGANSTGEYSFGLWKDRFLRQLAWYARPAAGTRHVRKRPLRAPTWSWASVKGHVRYFVEQHRVIPFVELVSGFGTETLVLRGYLQRCNWKRRVHDRGYGLDCGEVEFVIGDHKIEAFGYFDQTETLEECASGRAPGFVSMVAAFDWSDIGKTCCGMEGLLLHRIAGTADYERIGMFRVEEKMAGQAALYQYWRDEVNRSKRFGPLETVYLR